MLATERYGPSNLSRVLIHQSPDLRNTCGFWPDHTMGFLRPYPMACLERVSRIALVVADVTRMSVGVKLFWFMCLSVIGALYRPLQNLAF